MKGKSNNPLFFLNYLFQVSSAHDSTHDSKSSSSSMSRPSDVNENAPENKLAFYNILVGVVLIAAQFIFNRGFIGTGYNKIYFDIVFFCFLFLVVMSCKNTNFFKMGLVVGFSIYSSAMVLNHFAIFDKLATMIPIFGSQDLSIVIYYVVTISLSAFFAKAILQDNVKEVMDAAILAIMSIAIPFFLIKLNPYSSYLISNEIGGTWIKIFFSIPFLWQPFWIAGIFKRMNQGSKMATFFLTSWLILILGIVMIISYFSVPISARQAIQTSGSNFITGSFDDIQKAINNTKKYYDKNILGINEPTPIETQVDEEQKFPDKGFTISTIKISEGDYVDYGENAINRIDAWATLESKGLNKDMTPIKTWCELKLSGYEDLFLDDKREQLISGKINQQEDSYFSAKLSDFSVGKTVTCSFDKNILLNKMKGNNDTVRLKKIKQTTQSLTYYSNYSFKTGAYLTRYFMDSELFLELRKDSTDDYSLLSKQGVTNSQKYIRSRYTSGPLSVGISVSDKGIIIPFENSGDSLSNLLFTVEFAYQETDSSKEIKGLNDMTISIPDLFEINGDKCSPLKFVKIESSGMSTYKIADINEADKFFKMNYMDPKKRIMCPMIAKNDVTSNLFRGSFEVIADYKVSQKKSTTLNVKMS